MVPENKAQVVYGRAFRSQRGVIGYRVFTKMGKSTLPIVETSILMDIAPQKLELDHRDLKVMAGGQDRLASVRVTVTVGIPDEPDPLVVAAEHILRASHGDVARISRNFIEAHLRGVLRTLDFERATSDLVGTARQVQQMAAQDLMNIGLKVEDLTIHELSLRGG
jgi:flotillin